MLKSSKLLFVSLGCFLVALLVSGAAFSQEVIGGVAIPANISWEDLIKLFGAVIAHASILLTVLGMIGAVSFLVALLRFKPINDWLEKKGYKQFKAVLAAVLGGILTGLGSISAGTPLMPSIIAGVIFGLSSVGSYENKIAILPPKEKEEILPGVPIK